MLVFTIEAPSVGYVGRDPRHV